MKDAADPLLQAFGALKRRLGKVAVLSELSVREFVTPFLEVIRSEAVAGPITAVALDSVSKFLSYGIVAPGSPGLVAGVEDIADAVTHAKFVGTSLASDEVVLLKILQVLRTLLLVPVGNALSNEAVCELMQSCFRISCEPRLSELLRSTAEQTLVDMVHKLFARLGELDAEATNNTADADLLPTTLTTHASDNDSITGSPLKPARPASPGDQPEAPGTSAEAADEAANPATAVLNAAPPREAAAAAAAPGPVPSSSPPPPAVPAGARSPPLGADAADSFGERINLQGVRFEPQPAHPHPLTAPYGVPCVRELLRFLVSLITVRENPENMIRMGLSLLTVAMETGGVHLHKFPPLMEMAEDSLLRNLFQLLRHDNMSLFAAALRVIFLTFESQLPSLKFQLEHFLKLAIQMDYPSYEHKEGVLDTLLQLFCIPAFVTDLYINFDAHLYGGPLLEDLVRFLAQNAFSDAGDVPVMSTHLTALDTLLAAINQMTMAIPASLCSTDTLPSRADIVDIKRKKAILAAGSSAVSKKKI